MIIISPAAIPKSIPSVVAMYGDYNPSGQLRLMKFRRNAPSLPAILNSAITSTCLPDEIH